MKAVLELSRSKWRCLLHKCSHWLSCDTLCSVRWSSLSRHLSHLQGLEPSNRGASTRFSFRQRAWALRSGSRLRSSFWIGLLALVDYQDHKSSDLMGRTWLSFRWSCDKTIWFVNTLCNFHTFLMCWSGIAGPIIWSQCYTCHRDYQTRRWTQMSD